MKPHSSRTVRTTRSQRGQQKHRPPPGSGHSRLFLKGSHECAPTSARSLTDAAATQRLRQHQNQGALVSPEASSALPLTTSTPTPVPGVEAPPGQSTEAKAVNASVPPSEPPRRGQPDSHSHHVFRPPRAALTRWDCPWGRTDRVRAVPAARGARCSGPKAPTSSRHPACERVSLLRL